MCVEDLRILTFAVRPDIYSNNRLSLTLVDSPAADLLLLMTGLIREASFSLPDTLIDPQFGSSDDPSKSALMYHHKDKNIDGTLFDFLNAYVSSHIHMKLFDH